MSINLLDPFQKMGKEQPSRRSFLIKMGKLVTSLAGLMAGGGLAAGQGIAYAETLRPDSGCPLYCCTGTGCPVCACPSGTTPKYSWYCPYENGTYSCTDCYNNQKQLVCTWSYFENPCCKGPGKL